MWHAANGNAAGSGQQQKNPDYAGIDAGHLPTSRPGAPRCLRARGLGASVIEELDPAGLDLVLGADHDDAALEHELL